MKIATEFQEEENIMLLIFKNLNFIENSLAIQRSLYGVPRIEKNDPSKKIIFGDQSPYNNFKSLQNM